MLERPRKGARQGVVAVSRLVTSRLDGDNSRRVSGTRLDAICTISGRIEGGEWTRKKTRVHTSAVDWWAFIDSLRHYGSTTYLYSPQAADLACAVGLWGMLDAGDMHLKRLRQQRPDRRSKPIPEDDPRAWERGLFVDTDPPTVIQGWHRTGWSWEFRDCRNWLSLTEREIWEGTGREWRERPPEIASPESRIEWATESARAWAEAVHRTIKLWDHERWGRMPISVSGGALASYAGQFQAHSIVPPDSPDQVTWERQGAMTGRTECLWLGDTSRIGGATRQEQLGALADRSRGPVGPFHLVDCYSAYGAAMRSAPVPVRTIGFWSELMGEQSMNAPVGYDWMARVRIRTDAERYPVRTETGVVYPTGRYESILCGAELADAVHRGHVETVIEGWRYETAPALAEYSGHWLSVLSESRLNGEAIEARIAKAMLARLSGKFAQRPYQWQDRPELTPIEPWSKWSEINGTTGIVRRYRSISWSVQERIDGPNPPHVWPAIWAFVTSFGRSLLQEWLTSAGVKNVLYLATDALIVTQLGLERLQADGWIDDDEPGKLRVQETAQNVRIDGPGCYRLGDVERITGIAPTGEEIAPGVWRSERSLGMREIVNRSGVDSVNVVTEVTHRPHRATHGTVDEWGWVTPPDLGAVDRRSEAERDADLGRRGVPDWLEQWPT